MSPKARGTAPERARRARRRAAREGGPALAVGTLVVALLAVLGASVTFGGGSSKPSGRSEAGGGPAGPRVTVERGEIRVGEPFPAFSVTDVDGRVVTEGSLGGRPTIIWFTTSYCLPCQAGARGVARLDDRLGGDAFNVLVMFVDPSEGPAALTSWRERFGRPDWIVALDRNDTFARAVRLRALDTKLLLDARGMLRDVNLYPVDTAYLTLLQQAVRGTP